MYRKQTAWVFFFLFFVILNTILYDYLMNNPEYYQLDQYSSESEEFRAMELGISGLSYSRQFGKKYGVAPAQILTLMMLDSQFELSEGDVKKFTYLYYENLLHDIVRKKETDFHKLQNAYGTIVNDLVYFPIPESTDVSVPAVSFADSWGYERTYGGNRRHEGTDIMAGKKLRGYYPVVSITDGVVEKIGWLEQGGWRIGIRAPSGAYFYYAHLFNYARDFQPGDEIKAGDLIGFMGDSGYSKVEGTVGNFDVHLHLGIYLQTDHNEELSVNPYWILKYLEQHKLKYSY